MYDITAGKVMTPQGPAKYISFDNITRMVTVEHDYNWLVEYPAGVVYLMG